MSCPPRRVLPTLLLLVASLSLVAPVVAQRSTGDWRVADSVIIETEAFAPRLSPDGRWIAGIKSLDQRQICVWRVSTGEERCNEESDRVAEATIAWSPDSRRVAYSQNGHQLDSDIFVLTVRSNSLTNYTDDEVDDLKEAATANRFVIYDRWPVWTSDGEELVFLRILNPRDDEGQRQISVSRIVLETGQVVRGQDIMTDQPLELIAESLGVVTPPIVTPEGVIMFAIRGGQDIAGVYVVDLTQPAPHLLETTPMLVPSNVPLLTGATADGERLTFFWLWGDFGIDGVSATYGWLDRETGDLQPLDVRAPRRMTISSPPRFSPDGNSIVYAVTADSQTNRNSTVLVQDIATGTVTEVATGVSMQFWEGVTGITWSADNQLVLPLDDGSFEVITLERA